MATSPASKSPHGVASALNVETLDAITTALKQAGYQYVTLDTAGFRSGSLNAVLPADVLLRRGA